MTWFFLGSGQHVFQAGQAQQPGVTWGDMGQHELPTAAAQPRSGDHDRAQPGAVDKAQPVQVQADQPSAADLLAQNGVKQIGGRQIEFPVQPHRHRIGCASRHL